MPKFQLRPSFALVVASGLLFGLGATLSDRPTAKQHPTLPRGITPEGVAAIHFGMRLDQVEAVLGARAGDYRTRPVMLDFDSPEAKQWQEAFDNIMYDIDYLAGNTWYESKYWQGNAGNVWVSFDKTGRVAATGFIPARRQ